MTDLELGYRLFDAIPPHAHVIQLGDPNQLDPIAPGSVLKAVLSLEGLDHHKLTTTHRNDGDLLDVINAVGRGYCDGISTESVEFHGRLPTPTKEVLASFAQQIKEAANFYGGLEKVSVICPLRRGKIQEPGWNVTHLNHVLREAINPDPDESKRLVGTTFRMNDRILVQANMWIPPDERAMQSASMEDKAIYGQRNENGDVYVVNGDTGRIVGFKLDDRANHRKLDSIKLQLDDGRVVHFPAGELESLSLGYAFTVHAAQGSEYEKVFAVVTDGHSSFMHRSMLFTLLSRAKSEVFALGDPDVLAKVAARTSPHRNCSLAQRVLYEASAILGQNMSIDEHELQRNRHVA